MVQSKVPVLPETTAHLGARASEKLSNGHSNGEGLSSQFTYTGVMKLCWQTRVPSCLQWSYSKVINFWVHACAYACSKWHQNDGMPTVPHAHSCSQVEKWQLVLVGKERSWNIRNETCRVESPFRSKDSAQPRWFPPAAWQGGFSHLCLCQQQSNLQTNSTALSSKSAGQWYFHKIQTLHTGDTRGDALCSSLISLQFPTEQTSSSATSNRQRSKQARHCCESLCEPRMKFCTYLHLPVHLSAALLFSLSLIKVLPKEPEKQHTSAVKNTPEYSHNYWKHSNMLQPSSLVHSPIFTPLPYFSIRWNRKRFTVCTCPRARKSPDLGWVTWISDSDKLLFQSKDTHTGWLTIFPCLSAGCLLQHIHKINPS